MYKYSVQRVHVSVLIIILSFFFLPLHLSYFFLYYQIETESKQNTIAIMYRVHFTASNCTRPYMSGFEELCSLSLFLSFFCFNFSHAGQHKSSHVSMYPRVEKCSIVFNVKVNYAIKQKIYTHNTRITYIAYVFLAVADKNRPTDEMDVNQINNWNVKRKTLTIFSRFRVQVSFEMMSRVNLHQNQINFIQNFELKFFYDCCQEGHLFTAHSQITHTHTLFL